MERMLNGWVLVETIKEEKSAGGIYIPETSEKRLLKGVVKRAPKEKTEEFPYLLNEGDLVLFDSLGGVLNFELDEVKYDLLQTRSLVAVLEKGPEDRSWADGDLTVAVKPVVAMISDDPRLRNRSFNAKKSDAEAWLDLEDEELDAVKD